MVFIAISGKGRREKYLQREERSQVYRARVVATERAIISRSVA